MLLIILAFAVVTLVFNKLEDKVIYDYQRKMEVYSDDDEKMKSLITSYYSNKLTTVNIREWLIKIILIILMVVTIILQALIAFGIIPNDYIL